MNDPIITYRALADGGACREGILAAIRDLRAAGVEIPRRYSTAAVPLSTILRACGIETALDAAYWAKLNEPFLRPFACDCAERALLRDRKAGREPDPLSWAAVEVARRYALGEATDEERAAAWAAAGAAARAAEQAAELAAAWAAAWSAELAAEDAAWSAARDAEREWQAARLLSYLRGETPPPVEVA